MPKPWRQLLAGADGIQGGYPFQQLAVGQEDYDRIGDRLALAEWDYDKVIRETNQQRIGQWFTFEEDSIDRAAGAVGSTNGEHYTGQGVVNKADTTTGRSRIITQNSTVAGLEARLHLGGVPAGAGTRQQVRAAENWEYKVLILQSTAPVGGTQDYYTGLDAVGGGTGLRDGIYFRSTNAADWFLVCRSAGVESTVDMGIAPTTTLRLLEFRISRDGTKVQGYLNGRLRGSSITTNIPAGLMYIAIMMQDNRAATVTTAGVIEVYGWGMKGDLIA